MANLLFCDSFDHFHLANLGQKWGGTFTTISASIDAGRTVRAFRTVFNVVGNVAAGGITTIGAFRTSAITGIGSQQMGIGDPGAQCAALYFNTDGTCFVRDSTYALKGISTKVAIEGGVGHYIELALSGLGIVVRVDGEIILNVAGDTTGDKTKFFIGGTGGGNFTYYEDLYVADGFMDDVIIEAIYPNGAGNYSQWTPLAGANYTNVDEELASGTDYNGSSTISQIDTFTFEDVSFSGVIKGIQLVVYVSYGLTGSSIRGICRIAGTDYVHADTLSGTNQAIFHRFCWTISPATGIAWTQAELNAAEFGYRHEDTNLMYVIQTVVEVVEVRDAVARISQVVLEASGINLSSARVSQALVELLIETDVCTCPDTSSSNIMY